MDPDTETPYKHSRTGAFQKCRCRPQPFSYELEGQTAETAFGAVVLRAAFRKHNHNVRVGAPIDNGSLDLPLSHEEPRPLKPDLTKQLPMEILHQILMEAYDGSQTSNDICSCSRPGTSYSTVRARSLKHRVIDTFAIRLTCSRWHQWALQCVLSGPINGEFIELDTSNLTSLCTTLRLTPNALSRRLICDFPFLDTQNQFSGLTLYVGNPGELSNLLLIRSMLKGEKRRSKTHPSVFRGLSFWDLNHSVREDLQKSRWNKDTLVLLDILAYFSSLPVKTRIQFPTTIFSTVPQNLWKPVLRGLLKHTDNLYLREFQLSLHRPSTPTQNPSTDLHQYCKTLHTSTHLGPSKDWKSLRHLRIHLRDAPGDYGIDSSFLSKLAICNLTRLVSVHISGGLSSPLPRSSILRLLTPSSNTLQSLTFTPDYHPLDTHTCDILRSFPRLESLTIRLPCCPALFRHAPTVKYWRITIPPVRSRNAFVACAGARWTAGTLRELCEAARRCTGRVEIVMENVNVAGWPRKTDLVFRPVGEVPDVVVRTTTRVHGVRAVWEVVKEVVVGEERFLESVVGEVGRWV